MSLMRVAFSSDGRRCLSALEPGARGTIVEVRSDQGDHVERLLALGVTAGASVTLLQAFPGIIFLCDQTELAVERTVAEGIVVQI